MTHERDNLRDTVQAYRLENETLKTKLAEVNRELVKAREEVEDLKRAYGEVCAVRAAEELGGWLS